LGWQRDPFTPTINAGTAGVQHFFSMLYGKEACKQSRIGQSGSMTFLGLFGSPFAYAVEPLLPPDLVQLEMQLPFKEWADLVLTGGRTAAGRADRLGCARFRPAVRP
jgi:hypothetical protein